MEALKIIISIISGGAILELLKLLYPDLKKVFNSRIEAKKILNKHSDSILKASDELFGKLVSLAKDDFQIFSKYDSNKDEMNKIYILYLFTGFWASLTILKLDSSYIHLARIRKGRRLLSFITTYEAQKNRILDRSLQRAIGESILIINSNSAIRTMTLFEFTNQYRNSNSDLYKIIKPLEDSLFQTKNKEHRQKILLFGVIILALIDFLDKNHSIVRDRTLYLNKIYPKTKNELRLRVFNHYLPFVKNRSKYY